MMIDRAENAEAAWLELINDDPLHPVDPDLFHDACQELLQLYAVEDRWEDAYPVIWTAYDRGDPSDRPVMLTMRMRPELERITPKESITVLKRYVTAAADDWEALRALRTLSWRWGSTPKLLFTSKLASKRGPMTSGRGATISPCSLNRGT